MRNVSDAFKRAAFSQSADDQVFLVLLTLDHTELDDPIRLTNDSVNTVSRGNTYYAFPFNLILPDSTGDKAPQAKLTVDNVDRSFVAALRSISTAPYITLEIIRAAAPNTVEASWENFQLKDVTYNSLTIEGTLAWEEFLQEAFPAHLFCPSYTPGLF